MAADGAMAGRAATMDRGAAAIPGQGRVGPNAVIRVGEALRWRHGEATAHAVFARAGLEAYLAQPPGAMVPEREVARLHAALFAELGEVEGRIICREAGRRTGQYLLAHRIPKPAQALMRLLPAPLAARLLLAAITRHAWTFAGSGHFQVLWGSPIRLVITGGELPAAVRSPEPACDFFTQTFETIFKVLVSPSAHVVERECQGSGDQACVFELTW